MAGMTHPVGPKGQVVITHLADVLDAERALDRARER